MDILNESQIIEKLRSKTVLSQNKYYAYYSSWLGGITTDPHYMLLPIDDHMVHRGDGVFEAMKAVNRSVYLIDEHIKRLFESAEKISLKSSYTPDKLKALILALLKQSKQDSAIIRLFLSRGPGNFSVNPYDPPESQLYIIATELAQTSPEIYYTGVKAGISHIPVKQSWMSQIKSCNYLSNVLMKKESIDRKLDFTVGVDPNGYITESATENVLIVDKSGTLTHPPLENILKGTTMLRASELARENNIPTNIRPISVAELESVQEIILAGTTLDILSIVEFEGKKIHNGLPGPISLKLNQLIQEDIASGKKGLAF